MGAVRKVVLALSVLAAVALTVALVVALVVAKPPPASLTAPAPLTSALTQHLIVIVVDGLRYDTATDPEKMPHFARRMRDHASGNVRAGAVSMTSAAVLTLGTGQRGDVEQIVKNESKTRTLFNDVISNMKAAGLRTGCAGDPFWEMLFPDAWTVKATSQLSVAIGVDDTAKAFSLARSLLAERPRMNFMAIHFATPDHMAHHYGTFGPGYVEYIRNFDRDLEALLGDIPADTAVFVLSDHGATDSGAHGSDTPSQRQTPVFAFGQGIRAVPKLEGIDQADLAATFAALLGVSGPAHSRGHVVPEWLMLDEPRRAALSCGTLSQLFAYARAEGAPLAGVGLPKECSEGPRDGAVRESRRVARAVDDALGHAKQAWGIGLLLPMVPASLVLLLGVLWRLRTGTHARDWLRAFVLGLVLVLAAALLARNVELLPGKLPDPVRGVLYVLGNGFFLVAIVRWKQSLRWLDRNPTLGALLCPGLLIVTETTTTHPEAYVLAIIAMGVVYIRGLPEADGKASGRPPGWLTNAALGLVPALLLLPAGLFEHVYVPGYLQSHEVLAVVSIAGSIVLFALVRGLYPEQAGEFRSRLLWGAALALALVALVVRHVAPAPLALSLWVVCTVLAVVGFSCVDMRTAELLLLASYLLTSRDAEVPYVLLSYLALLSLVGRVRNLLRADVMRPGIVLIVVGFVFAWSYVQHVAVQLGLHFVGNDFGALAFRQEDVSIVRIGLGIFSKFVAARALLYFAVLRLLPRVYLTPVFRGLLVAETARILVLSAMLVACRTSFWTPIWILGDLPHSLFAVLLLVPILLWLDVRKELPLRDGKGRMGVAHS